jgi:hypothetical protein
MTDAMYRSPQQNTREPLQNLQRQKKENFNDDFFLSVAKTINEEAQVPNSWTIPQYVFIQLEALERSSMVPLVGNVFSSYRG